MIRILSLLFSFLLASTTLLAQLPNGSIAPNWTMSDLNGVSHTLYNYLNNNKVVYLDFSATWCAPCWSYHNSHAFRDVYNAHGPPGDNKVMAFMIETDPSTNTACLYGLPTCVGGTQGNWVNGVPYPIIDNASQSNPYDINYYPTIYGVCPDKKIYEIGQPNAGELWEFAQGCSAPFLTVNSVTHINCYGNSIGSINIGTSGGMPPFTFLWSNGATTQNLANLPAGSYSLTVTGSLGGTRTIGPITIQQPAAPLAATSLDVMPQGCAGMGGSIAISVNGGTVPYAYQWSNGGNTAQISNLQAGTYWVVVTDANGCTIGENNIVVAPPSIPVAAASTPGIITCANQSVTLNGNGSSTGPVFIYNWSTTDGYIVSGASTLNNCIVNDAGTYHLLVQNTSNNCLATASTLVNMNQVAPDVTAGPPGAISCTNPQTTLNGVGPTGSNFTVLWTTAGGNIVSGATTLNPVVNAAGSYTLTITNTVNGCSGSSTTTVNSNIAAPNVVAMGGTITCTNASVTLSGNSSTPNATYSWSGPNGFNSPLQNPTASAQGSYVLTVTNPGNGCTASATATVSQNTTQPQASAQGGTITCSNANVNLSGSSTTPNVTYGWTGPNNYTSNLQNPSVSTVGNYVLTVTGSNGCTQTATGNVSQNTTLPTANAGPSGVLNCNAYQVVLNGTASSAGSQFTYLWTTAGGHIASGETTLTPTVDSAGNYVLTVTNSTNGCTNTASTSVQQRLPVSANIASQTNVACFGSATGSATASGSGGNGNFIYNWSNGVNTPTASNLGAGIYTIVVTDGENCTATNTVAITQPTAVTINVTTTPQSIPGENNGTATANPQGGVGGYSYQWSNLANTQTITGLAPGNYAVSVTDANGCQKSQAVTVNVFGCSVSATIASQDATCHGSNDGAASITLANAALPQVFLWSNGAQTSAIENLGTGAYSVTATDGNGCEVVASIEIGEPNPLNANATSTGLTGTGANDGTATANPTGGTQPFNFAWSNGQNSQSITGLSSANYIVSVTDANGCTVVQTVPVAPFMCATTASISASQISCFGANDGQATVTLAGGLTPYTYQWSNGEATATIKNLVPGTYSVSIADAVNCPATVEVNIVEPTLLALALNEISDTDCGANNGHATVEATGGNASGGYDISWSNGQTGPFAGNLAAGNYLVSVVDNNGCAATLQVQVKINDTELPVVLTQDITVALGTGGTASLAASQLDNGSTDNCSIESMSIDQTIFDCSNLGFHEIHMNVVDVAGNVATGTATIQVVDNLPPVVSVQNVTVYLDETGTANMTPQMVNAGSTDNCGIAEQSIDKTDFTCNDLGDNAVVLTIADASGNIATGTAIVTVQDIIEPNIVCPGDMVLAYCDPVGNFTIETNDNCTQNLTPSLTAGLPSGSTFPTGTTVQTFEVNDGHGNQGTCSFKVSVPPAMEVDIAATNASCFGAMDGHASANVTGGTEAYNYLWSNGETSPGIQNLAVGDITVSVTDAAGCVQVQNAIITEPSALIAVINLLMPETIGQQDGAIEVTLSGGTPQYSYEWTNGNGNVVGNLEDISNIAAGNYTLQVTDANGCISYHVFTVQSISNTTNHALERHILLFPNPTNGLVNIAFDKIDAGEADIEVYEMTGKLTASYRNANVSSGMFVMNLGGYADGIYLVKIRIANQMVLKRLAVQR